MERLTDEVLHNAIKTYEITSEIDDPDYSAVLDKCILEFLHELKAYRDAEEQGLLIRLPLAKGDAFWEINRGTTPASCYKRYAHLLAHCVYVLERLGKTCFLTKEEAEAALAEMEK